ncbi:hypothetical protein SynMINOS11_00617 [Synechococcus sp. Minos11]|nr:hypothetical protein SynMINOS11_00617 [Synechococcus sp. Minos11]
MIGPHQQLPLTQHDSQSTAQDLFLQQPTGDHSNHQQAKAASQQQFHQRKPLILASIHHLPRCSRQGSPHNPSESSQ